ncbi:MAG: PAS domain S-box protein, partial [Elusimicrobiota bacterium]
MEERTKDLEPLSEIASRAARRLAVPACVLAELRPGGSTVLAFAGVSAAEAALLVAAQERTLNGKPGEGSIDGGAPLGAESARYLIHNSRPIEDGGRLSLSCFDKDLRELSGASDLLGLWAEEALQRLFPGRISGRALEANSSIYASGFFLRYLAAEIAAGSKAALLVFHIDKLQEIRRDHGERTAVRLLAQLGDLLRSRARSGDVLGRLFDEDIGMMLPDASGPGLPSAATRLSAQVREGFRFSVSVGGSADSDAERVLEGARHGLGAAIDAGGGRTRLWLEGRLIEPEAALPGARETADPAALFQERYQKLVLLNRASLKLFSGESLDASLASAGLAILALSGAKYISIHQAEGPRLLCLHRHGEKLFLSEEARGSENSLLERLRSDLSNSWLVQPGLGLLGVPILASSVDARFVGALVTGYLRNEEPGPEVVRLLADTAKLVCNAFVVHGQLREQKRLAAVAEQSADPLFLTDLEGRILASSRGALETFGYAPEQVLGRQAADLLVPPDRRERYLGLERETLEKGSVLSVEGIHLRSDGTPIPVEMTFTLIRDDHRRPFEMVRVVRDISQRKEVERMKTEFVNIVSHELRT